MAIKVLEILELPDGFDATVDGDGGRRILHFLTKPTSKIIMQAYTTAIAIIEPTQDVGVSVQANRLEVILKFEALPTADEVKAAYIKADLSKYPVVVEFIAKPAPKPAPIVTEIVYAT